MLPWYAEGKSDPNDQYFTQPKTAAKCARIFREVADQHGFDLSARTWIEPSAGDGCFSSFMPANHISLDLQPRSPNTRQADFLKWMPPQAGSYACLGNPPFGHRGATALAFVNRAARFADIIGFILPMTFESRGKGAARTRVKGLSLLYTEELPLDAFCRPNGKPVQVNTVFQIWGRGVVHSTLPEPTCNTFADIRTVCSDPKRWCGLASDLMSKYARFVASSFYSNRPAVTVHSFDDVSYGSGYGVIPLRQYSDVIAALDEADWLKHSSRATNSCRHIRKEHIRDVLIEAGLSDD